MSGHPQGSSTHLGGLSWPEVPDRPVLVVPLGSCEQHGPHLPLDTDTRIAEHLASALVDRSAPGAALVITPTIGIGASGEHAGFPGTLSIGSVALEAVVVELVRSAMPQPDAGATGQTGGSSVAGVVVVNGHGGNVEATTRAVGLLRDEGRDLLVWHPRVPDGDSHAGRTETSLLLHLDPSCVRLDRAETGSTARWREISDRLRSGGLADVSPNGVLGDPTTASAAEGRELFGNLVDDLVASVAAWRDTLGR